MRPGPVACLLISGRNHSAAEHHDTRYLYEDKLVVTQATGVAQGLIPEFVVR